MASSPILTAAWFFQSTDVVRQTAAPSSETRDLHQGETIFIPLVSDDVPAARIVPEYAQEQDSSEESTDDVALASSAASNAKSTNDAQRLIEIVQPWCVLCWFIGVGILTLRLTAGVIRVRKWRKSAIQASPRDVQTMFAALLRRMNIRLPVKLLESSHVAVPMVIGWIKPAVLLPPSLISNLSTDELESILAHELAHIRRLDPFVNVMQLIVETLLFYHPAVWWVSRQIRVERENCCDDVAVSVCGSPVLFARALTRLEEARISETRLVLSANHGSLLRRIQRLVAKEPTSATEAWPVSLIATGLLVLLVAGFWMSTATAADQTELKQDESQQEASDNFDDDQDEKPKTVVQETTKQDSKTGINQALFPSIRLSCDADGVEHRAKLDMKYSNVIRYSFIPASVAASLNAVDYGTIDFGDQPPNAKGGFPGQTLELDWDTLRKLDAAGDLSDSGTVQLGIPEQPPQQLQDLAKKRHHLNELKQPLADDQTIAPYADDPLWAPGHLGFYGMNQTEQTKFRVVRIDQVSLGIGPAIGPVFALVNDDENSDFGLLGSDWARQVQVQ